MEESAFIKCPSCLSEIEITRSSFYRVAGKVANCPECNSPIPIPSETNWQDFAKGPVSESIAGLKKEMAADLQASFPDEDEEGASIPTPAATAAPAWGKTAPEAFTRNSRSMNKAVAVVVAGLLLSAVGIVICVNLFNAGKASAPALLPAVPTTTTTTSPVARPVSLSPVVVPALSVSTDEVTATVLFKAYREAFLRGKLEEAKARQRDVDAFFSASSARDAFWNKVMPEDEKKMMRLMALCSACVADKGKCPHCKGHAICPVCQGKKICQWCKGHSTRKKLCPDCVCRACSASGVCLPCQGTGHQSCQNCGGSGATDVTVHETCPSCGGSGYKPGLRKAGGAGTSLPCLTCRTRGWISRTMPVTCGICDGKGWVPCSSCGGNGKCAVCGGRGHKIPCDTCGSTGYITVHCPKCGGSGKCADCEGTGVCSLCRGTGVCGLCGGKGLTEILRLPVLSEWLRQSKGYAMITSDGALQQEASAIPGHIVVEQNGRSLSFDLKSDEIVVIVQTNSSECLSLIRKP